AGGDPVRAGPGAYAPGIRGADPPGPAAARGIPALRRTGRPVARRPPAGTLARFHRCRRDPGKAALHRLDAWRQLLRHLAAPLDGIRFRPVPAPRAGAGRETAWPPDPARRHPGREPGRGAGGLRAPGPGLRGAGPRRHRPGPLRHGRLAGGAVRAGALHDGSLAQGGGRAVNAWARPLLAALLALSATACSTLSPQQRDRAAAVAVSARDSTVECTRADRCAEPSPLRELAGEAFAETASAPDGQPRHRALILDEGGDALLARINLMRSATRRIDLQTYIFDKDDSARLVIDELLAAARRGVKVRVLIDQLSAIADLQILGALAGAHENLQLRIYNPTFGRAKPNYLHYAASVICCFRRFNQRMHNKLLVVDDAVGISGGRNYQDDYYDWDAEYNFRDRDVLVAGPVVREMERNFALYWNDRRSVPVERLDDVGRLLLASGV